MQIITQLNRLLTQLHYADDVNAVKAAIKKLEQEPCEDAIGREDMLDAIGHGTTYTSEELQRIIKGLPPVNPQPKTGHWEWLTENKYRCSNCKHETRVDECMGKPMYDFCPFCRARMESEDK